MALKLGDLIELCVLNSETAVGQTFEVHETLNYGSVGGDDGLERKIVCRIGHTPSKDGTYAIFKVADAIPKGTVLKSQRHTDKYLTQGAFMATLAEVLSLPAAKPSTRLCKYGFCLNHACIDSYYCLDHQECDKNDPYVSAPAGYSVPATEHSVISATDGYKVAQDYYQGLQHVSLPEQLPSYLKPKESDMQGQAYTGGSVVKTKTVAAAEGVTTGVLQSEIVFTLDKPFIALNDEIARSYVLATAASKVKDFNILEQGVTFEVKLGKLT